MPGKLHKMYTAFCAAILVPFVIHAAEPDMIYRNAKAMGMGDTKVAGGFTYNGFIHNPSLLTRVRRLRFCVVRIPLTVNDHTYDFADFVKDESGSIIDYANLERNDKKNLISEIIKREGAWGRVYLSPMFDIAMGKGKHRFGLACFATNRIGIKMDRGIYEPRVFGKGESTIALVLGYARPVPEIYPGLNIGINVKFLERRQTRSFQLRARDLGNIFETAKPIYDEYRKKTRDMFVLDIGTLWELPGIDSFAGITAQYLGMIGYTSIDAGFAKRFLGRRLLVAADIIDIFDNNKENVFRKFHFGAEYRYLFLAFRSGINAGYPTAGLGVNFRVVDLDVAYYAEELSKRPGGKGDDRYMAQLKFGW